jgi:hypothetical protein
MDEQELQRLRSENADYVKQLEENKAELDKVRNLNISLIGGLSHLFSFFLGTDIRGKYR